MRGERATKKQHRLEGISRERGRTNSPDSLDSELHVPAAFCREFNVMCNADAQKLHRLSQTLVGESSARCRF